MTDHFDIDIYADGILAHRAGIRCQANPFQGIDTYQYLSWNKGWNDRELYIKALKARELLMFKGP